MQPNTVNTHHHNTGPPVPAELLEAVARALAAALIPPPRRPPLAETEEAADFLTAAQLARRLGVSRETVRRLAIAGALPHTVVCQGARRTTRRYPRRFAEGFAASGLETAQTVARALEAAVPGGPAAPYWIGLDRDTYHARLAELQRWADTVLRQQYGGYELRDCWPRHVHAIWELSTLAAEWHRTYGGPRPDLARALEFNDRWLPGTVRRITGITGTCVPRCVMLRRPGDWAAGSGYR